MLSLIFPSLFPRSIIDFIESRVYSIKYGEYIRYLIMYKDGRFTQHPRFRYVIYNTIKRRQTRKKAKFFLKHNPQYANISTEELTTTLATKQDLTSRALLSTISAFTNTIRRTRLYQIGKRSQLKAYIRALRILVLFLTYSTANNQQYLLYKYIPTQLEGSLYNQAKLRRNNLRDNPYITIYYFYRRFTLFQKIFVYKKFNVVDYQNRYEFQARSSSYNYGLVQVRHDRDPTILPLLSTSTKEEYNDIATFQGNYISIINPNLDRIQPKVSEILTLSITPNKIENSLYYLIIILNRVQRYATYSKTYYLRQRYSSSKICRFKFPRALQEAILVIKKNLNRYLIFYSIRNNTRINYYNRSNTIGQLRNTNINTTTSIDIVTKYLSKYVTKVEERSQTIYDIYKLVLLKISDRAPILSLVAKVLNRLISERDVST